MFAKESIRTSSYAGRLSLVRRSLVNECQKLGAVSVSCPMEKPSDVCIVCKKPADLCVCSAIEKISTKTKILILQHPQEPDKELGSATILHAALPNSKLIVGLSWPNLAKACGETVDAKNWGVLFLGGKQESREKLEGNDTVVQILARKGAEHAVTPTLEGVIVLDGNWRQAKAMWWRNAWLLKLQRVVLNPRSLSLYGKLRREPRKESISTLEAVALCLSHLENDPSIENILSKPFELLLEKYRTSGRRAPQAKKIDYRRRRGNNPRRSRGRPQL